MKKLLLIGTLGLSLATGYADTNSTDQMAQKGVAIDYLALVYVSQPYQTQISNTTVAIPYQVVVSDGVVADRTFKAFIPGSWDPRKWTQDKTVDISFSAQDSEGRRLAGLVDRSKLNNLRFSIMRNGALIHEFDINEAKKGYLEITSGNDEIKIQLKYNQSNNMVNYTGNSDEPSRSMFTIQLDILSVMEDLSQQTMIRDLMPHF